MKSLAITNYDVVKTSRKINWFRSNTYYEISMTFLSRSPMPGHKHKDNSFHYDDLTIAGVRFSVLAVEETREAFTHERLYSVTVQQINASKKKYNKRAFQYAEITVD